ncbi:two-component system histidine kinase PnpS [Tindallia magadiensis]|uniref:two-component system histidine kinase PnpS n=1 Tax=Tindallia magadiensis TaxID=69895 RepID=UPI0038CD2C8F
MKVLKRKIFWSFLVILLISSTLIGFLSVNLVNRSYTNELEKRLLSNAQLIATMIRSDELDPASNSFQQAMKEMAEVGEVRITIIDSTGKVLTDTRSEAYKMDNHLDRPEVHVALVGKEQERIVRYSHTTDQEMLYVAFPVKLNNSVAYAVRLSMDLSEIEILTRNIVRYIAISTLFGLLIAILLGSKLIDKMIDSIKALVNMTKQISEGDYERRIYLTNDDELAELAEHFNHMADKLNRLITQLSESNSRFQALLASINNPIIAVDPKEKVTLMNVAAEKLFNVSLDDIKGHHLLEVIRNNELDELIKRSLKERTENQFEINLKVPEEKIFRVYTNLIYQEEDPIKVMGLVILIDDITEIRKLEKIRSEFVTNVTHELKTPLTSISGFVETLKSGEIEDEETQKRFLEIIEIETERLTRLINDILTLSEIENIKNKDSKSMFNPSRALKEVESMMRPMASVKGIEFYFEIPGKLSCIKGNEDRMKQMMINLIDNAIKYTPNGGKISFIIYERYGQLVLRVKDTGIGIPEKDIPRLFERFYRVDKARSKKMGGTGLGLAIVKHIVISMAGKIKVHSAGPGKGTEFVISLPLHQ